jgi:leucyl-tRNA synthetase
MGANHLVIKVNGKIRDMIANTADAKEDEILAEAKQSYKVSSAINNRRIRKVVYVPGQYINIVTSLSQVDCVEEEG